MLGAWREEVGESTSEDGGHIYARVCCNPPPTPPALALALLHSAPLFPPFMWNSVAFPSVTFWILIRGPLNGGTILFFYF